MFTDIICRFLILETFVMGVLCWYCPNYHVQTQYCVSEFVFIANPIKPVNKTGPHRLRIITLFKGNKSLLDVSRGNIINMETDLDFKSMSEVFLPGDKYVVFGRNKNGIVYADQCIAFLSVEKITPFMEFALHYYYFLGCDCIHEISNDYYGTLCERKYSYISRDGRKCTWFKGSSFRKCQKGLLSLR